MYAVIFVSNISVSYCFTCSYGIVQGGREVAEHLCVQVGSVILLFVTNPPPLQLELE